MQQTIAGSILLHYPMLHPFIRAEPQIYPLLQSPGAGEHASELCEEAEQPKAHPGDF